MQSLWMLVAALLFAVMGACVKLVALPAWGGYSIAEIVFYRSLLGALALAAFVRSRGLSLATPVVGMHLRRSTVGTVALSLWFFSSTVLPLGTAMTLNYSSSLFLAAVVVAAALLSRRRVRWSLALTVLFGFVGVVLVLQPSFSADQSEGALAGLASGILSAAAYWHVKELGRLGEPEWRTVFYFSLTGAVLGLVQFAVLGDRVRLDPRRDRVRRPHSAGGLARHRHHRRQRRAGDLDHLARGAAGSRADRTDGREIDFHPTARKASARGDSTCTARS